MVFGQSNNGAYHVGASASLRAEDFFKEHVPSGNSLHSMLLHVWTGISPGLENHGATMVDPNGKHHERDTVLFEEKDMVPWIVFTLSFFVLVIFDNTVLHRKAEKLSLSQALLYTVFWITVAAAFGFYVYMTRGVEDAFSWGTGYLLEWMLSVDNLFVFHRIFEVFATPDELKHKPLFYGIIGAIVFRMIFFLIGELLMHHVWWIHIIFGMFLIYTGIKAVTMDEDDDPTESTLFQSVIKHINYVDRYDPEGRFFVPVEEQKASAEDLEQTAPNEEQPVVKYQATRLVLVVICLEITDLLFAFDSVSAIVAQIPDLFLAYTACVFAMLGLRALFFAVHELVNMFSLLSYGVAFILVFLGCKLILKSWIHFSPKLVCTILVGTIAISIVGSIIHERFFPENDEKDEESDGSPRAEKADQNARSETDSTATASTHSESDSEATATAKTTKALT